MARTGKEAASDVGDLLGQRQDEQLEHETHDQVRIPLHVRGQAQQLLRALATHTQTKKQINEKN